MGSLNGLGRFFLCFVGVSFDVDVRAFGRGVKDLGVRGLSLKGFGSQISLFQEFLELHFLSAEPDRVSNFEIGNDNIR